MEAYIDSYDQIAVAGIMKGEVSLFCNGSEVEKLKVVNGIATLKNEIVIPNKYYIYNKHQMCLVEYRDIVLTDRFEREYRSDKELGSIYKERSTLFRVFAPTAYSMRLKLDTNFYNMCRDDDGVYEIEVVGNFKNKDYTYLVEHKKVHEVIDPYAKLSGLNCKYSVVLDKNDILEVNAFSGHEKLEKVIYETHVRDLTHQLDIKTKETFLGLSDDFVINHLKELGVNTMQIMPMYDYGSVCELGNNVEYNWGYDPVQYNCLEGTYVYDKSQYINRINELVTSVNKLHANDISVHMDVVYNHVYDVDTFSFNTLVPKYFFRYKENGEHVNSCFCSNDVASDRYMARKFIVDSTKYLTKTFGFDGFRFDLMGIHDVETMNTIVKELKVINPNIHIYGEGWQMNTMTGDLPMAHQYNYKQTPELGFFNDTLRNYIKGGDHEGLEKGFIEGARIDDFEHVFKNEIYLNHTQSINYVSCHDDHTLFDFITTYYGKDVEAKSLLAQSLVILSFGIPFIHSGCEFLRTKGLIRNTFNLPIEVNRLDWSLKKKNREFFEWISKLIRLRKASSIFKEENYVKIDEQVNSSNDENVITINYANEFTLLVNMSDNEVKVFGERYIGNDVLQKYEMAIVKGDRWNI